MNVTPKGPASLRLKEGNPITDKVSADETVQTLTQQIRDNEKAAMSAQDALYATLDVAIKEGVWREVQDTSISIEERYDALNRRFFADSKKVSVPVEGDKGTKRRVYERDVDWSKLSFSRAEFLQMHANLGGALAYSSFNRFLDREEDEFRLTDIVVLNSIPVNAIDNPLLQEVIEDLKNGIFEAFDERLTAIKEVLTTPESVKNLSLENLNDLHKELQSSEDIPVSEHELKSDAMRVSNFVENIAALKHNGRVVASDYKENSSAQADELSKASVMTVCFNLQSMEMTSYDKGLVIADGSELFYAATGLDEKTWERALDKTIFYREDYARIPDRIVRDTKRVANKIQKKLGM